MTCTKFTFCPVFHLGAGLSSLSSLWEIRVISDPESIMTVDAVPVTELTVTGTWVVRNPRKEHPGGCAISLFNSSRRL